MCSDSAREALADLDVADVLTFQLKEAPDAERRHVILEILGSLGESGKAFILCGIHLNVAKRAVKGFLKTYLKI